MSTVSSLNLASAELATMAAPMELESAYAVVVAVARSPASALVVVPPSPDDFAYDVFVSYARRDPADCAWVELVLVPFLEGCGLKVCLEHRDFQLGQMRLREMERAATDSRYTLAVFSPAYLDDGFTDFQTLSARHLALETREARLIAVLRRACKLELGERMTSLLDLTREDDVPAGLQRLARTLRERPHPRPDR
jgi:hypothetical protein